MLSRASKGFSVLELLVVMTILVFAMGFGYPMFSTWLTNLKIRSTAEKVQSSLHMARTEAMRRNKPITLYFTSSLDNSCTVTASGVNAVVSQTNPAGKCGTATSDVTVPQIIQKESVTFGGPVTVTSSNTTGTVGSITFNGFGRVVTTSNWITQLDFAVSPVGTTKSLRIQITPGGSSRMCDPAVADTTDTRSCG